ncbi:MAG: ferredoxin [Gammaproteobacteria bacterium]|nr:MAG: ferredoxin [Gammaproteobacteria bacterium]
MVAVAGGADAEPPPHPACPAQAALQPGGIPPGGARRDREHGRRRLPLDPGRGAGRRIRAGHVPDLRGRAPLPARPGPLGLAPDPPRRGRDHRRGRCLGRPRHLHRGRPPHRPVAARTRRPGSLASAVNGQTYRACLAPSGRCFPVQAGESLLEAGLRAGFNLPYRCTNGTCGVCRARLRSGRLRRLAPHEYRFTAREKAAGEFLLCRNTADSDLELEVVEIRGVEDIPVQRIETRVSRLHRLREDVMEVQLRTPRSRTLQFLAGQYVTLRIPGLQPRNKSVASCPCNGMILQFHVHRVAGDPFSEHVFERMRPHDPVALEGPHGNFVLDEAAHRPLVFLAYETGFAPIKSLIEHAISLELAQPMTLYWVVGEAGGHYLDNQCRAWEDALDNFRYVPLVGGAGVPVPPVAETAGCPPPPEPLRPQEQGLLFAAARAVAEQPDLSGVDVYANGPPGVMCQARTLLQGHGLPAERLFVDPLRHFI